MSCPLCRSWRSGCDGPAVGRAWAALHGFTGPLAPQAPPPGPKCPSFEADKRATSRTLTPVVR